MNKDFSSTQGENGWYYVTNDGHVWDWGANYGPQNLVELTWDEEQNAYVSEFGNKVTSDGISYPLTGNNHMTLVKWAASADGTYDLKYNLNFYDRCNIIIYRVESKNIANYYYIVKIEGRVSVVNLIYQEKETKLKHNSFGLLDSFDKNKEEETLKFHIEVDGKTIEYVLN